MKAENLKDFKMNKIKKIPQAVEFEEVVLGAAIGSGGASEMIEILKKEKVFYKPQHQLIYDSIVEMYEASEGIDLMTVSSKLKSKNLLEKVGGDYFIIGLTQKVVSNAHIEFHCRIILQQFVKRQAIKVATNLVSKSYDDDVDIFDLLDDSYKTLDEVSDSLFTKKPDDFKSNVAKLFEFSNNSEPGIPCALQKVQSKFNGYQKSNLIILAARPGMGKTAYIINETINAAKNGIPIGIFSLEMSARELTARMMANYCKINSTAISLNQTNDFELRMMNEKREEFEKLPIFIHDEAAMTPMEIKIQSKKWAREKGVQMFFIDYLQLMKNPAKGGNREQEVSDISRSLKALAKELDLPIMALSQLSRAVETRGGSKRPILSDLRESGSIEQDADIVSFIYRPEYYKIDEWDDAEGGSTKNQAEIIIAKFRNGSTGACIVGCELEFMRFENLESDFEFPETVLLNENVTADTFGPPKKIKEDEDDLPF